MEVNDEFSDLDVDNAWNRVEGFIRSNIELIKTHQNVQGNMDSFDPAAVRVLFKAGVSSAIFEYVEVILKEHLSKHTSIQFLTILHLKHIDEENEDDEVFKNENELNKYIKKKHKYWKTHKLTPFSNSLIDVTNEFKLMRSFIFDFVTKVANAIETDNKLNVYGFSRDSQIYKMLLSLKYVLSTHIFSSMKNHASSSTSSCHHNHAKSAITYLFWITLKLKEKTFRLENSKKENNDDSMISEEDEDEDSDSDNEEDEEEEEEMSEEEEMKLLERIKECWDGMSLLGWLEQEDITQQLSSLIHNEINELVIKKTSGEFASPLLEKLINRCKLTILPTLRMIFGGNDSADDFFRKWEDKVVCWVQVAFCQSRITDLYDCILDFPDSVVAVTELRQALEITQLHSKLALQLRQTLKRRLLHSGATTGQIIDIYISTIKVLRVLDSSSDGVLDTVAGPLRDYLRERKDCVRRIVTSLTDEEADLYEELQRNSGNDGHEFGDKEEDDEDETVDWMPQLRSVALMKKLNGVVQGSERGYKKFDILGNLLSIYGSKEVFIDEYRVMLCSRLLKNYNYDTSRDVATLELLKLRFGENVMYECEIMIRDIDESKRLNSGIQGKLKADDSNSQLSPTAARTVPMTTDGGSVVNATVVSEHFWPSLQDNEGVILHPVAAELLEQYNQTYSIMKKPRELKWREQLGLVDLELEFEDGSNSTFKVSPLHATLILHFSNEDEEDGEMDSTDKALTVSQLVQLTGLESDDVVKKMEFWANEGIVIVTSVQMSDGESECSYQAEKFPFASGSREKSNQSMDNDENGEISSMNSKANSVNKIKVFRNFVTGMLKNLDSMPLERVHNMLKMYTTDSDTKYEMSTHELNDFLNDMINEELVEYAGGEYKLVRK